MKVKITKGFKYKKINFFSSDCIGEIGEVIFKGWDDDIQQNIYHVEFDEIFSQYIPETCCEVIES